MNWFKSIWLTSEERAILQEAKRKRDGNVFTSEEVQKIVEREVGIVKENTKPSTPARPYNRVIYDGRSIQVIFNDGSVYSKLGVDGQLFREVRDAKTEEEIYKLLQDEVIESITVEIDSPEEKKLVKENSTIFDGHNDFEKRNGEIFMKGVNLALPSIVAATFIEILEKLDMADQGTNEWDELQDNYHALKMFWLKLALNPLPQSREDLLLFVKKNDVRITKNGNLVLYRRIVSYKDKTDHELTTFISQNYADRKRQKKAHTHPRNYSVYKDADGKLILWDGNGKKPKADRVGNLEQLYKDLPTMVNNVYTSAHNRGKLKIKIGGIYQIPEDEINLDNGLCAAGGLHAAAVDYNYSGFGDVPVVVLVNPSKAITVPTNEWKKLRTTEMFIAAINDKPHGEHFDDGALSAFDEEYHDFTLGELEEAVKNKDIKALSISGHAPAVDENAIKVLLKTRVKSIV